MSAKAFISDTNTIGQHPRKFLRWVSNLGSLRENMSYVKLIEKWWDSVNFPDSCKIDFLRSIKKMIYQKPIPQKEIDRYIEKLQDLGYKDSQQMYISTSVNDIKLASIPVPPYKTTSQLISYLIDESAIPALSSDYYIDDSADDVVVIYDFHWNRKIILERSFA